MTEPSLAELAKVVEQFKALPRGPSIIFVRRDAWPTLKAELESLCVVKMAPEGPVFPCFTGIPVLVVDYLPRPWMTDLDMGPLAPKRLIAAILCAHDVALATELCVCGHGRVWHVGPGGVGLGSGPACHCGCDCFRANAETARTA